MAVSSKGYRRPSSRIEVLNEHECHAGITRHMTEQIRECFQSAGRGAYANHNGE